MSGSDVTKLQQEEGVCDNIRTFFVRFLYTTALYYTR